MRPAGGHEINSLHGSNSNDPLIAATIAHHTDRFHRQEHRESLTGLVIPPRGAQLFDKNRIGASEQVGVLLFHLAENPYAQPRPREGVAEYHVTGQPQLETNAAHLVFKEFSQRLHQFKRHILGQAADVVMGFDHVGLASLSAGRLDDKEKAVGKKGKSGIKEGRFTTIKSQLKHIKEYIGEDCVMDVLHANSFSEYAQYRDEQGAAQSTIMNEQATLNSFCKFSREQGWINIERFKVDEISKEGVDNRRIARQTFSDAEYKAIYNDLKSYASKKRIKQDKLNEADAWTRQLFRHYCLIAANTGMRTGELWKLQWENVEVREAETKKGELVAEIIVLAETTKVGKQRKFVARGGQHFKRLRELSPFNKKSDYVFTLADGRTWSGDNRRSFDYQYHKLMERVGIEDWKERNLTSYAFRHYACTKRIIEGANLAILAHDMGTSIIQFQKTYFHVNMIDSERNMLVRRDKRQ
jgi:integrase